MTDLARDLLVRLLLTTCSGAASDKPCATCMYMSTGIPSPLFSVIGQMVTVFFEVMFTDSFECFSLDRLKSSGKKVLLCGCAFLFFSNDECVKYFPTEIKCNCLKYEKCPHESHPDREINERHVARGNAIILACGPIHQSSLLAQSHSLPLCKLAQAFNFYTHPTAFHR